MNGMELLTWVGILVCLSQSAILSGLDLACFNTSKLRLQVEAAKGVVAAQRTLRLRQNANFLLTTILWANVSVNVLLALLSNSVLAGVGAFFFSTFVITSLGEILPQAYFSRHAIRFAGLFYPLLRVYQVVFYPVARPSAWVLDRWFGREGVSYYHERDLYELIKMHMRGQSEIGEVEGMGAMNFLLIDDLPLAQQGRRVERNSIVRLPFEGDRPQFPPFRADPADPFLSRLHAAGQRWIILTDLQGAPRCLLDADSLLKDVFFSAGGFDLSRYLNMPVIVRDGNATLGEAMKQFKVDDEQLRHDSFHVNIILVWGEKPRIVTGKEILARLLKGIVQA